MHSFHTFGAPTLTMEIVKEWASDACSKYVTEGTDPTSSLTKLAQDNSLTPHQIEVLAGEINKSIHIVKYASVEEKYHAADFPLADAKTVIHALQNNPNATEKTASTGLPAFFPDPFTADTLDNFESFGVAEEPLTKTASEVKYEMKIACEKLTALSRDLNDKAFLAQSEKHASENSFIETARQYVLDGFNCSDRFTKLCEVEHAVKCANMQAIAKKPLAKLAYVLGKEGAILPTIAEKAMEHFLTKTADEKAPENLISPYLQARVVNGNHPLLITLKTYADAYERELQERNRANIVDDKLNIMAQKIREL